MVQNKRGREGRGGVKFYTPSLQRPVTLQGQYNQIIPRQRAFFLRTCVNTKSKESSKACRRLHRQASRQAGSPAPTHSVAEAAGKTERTGVEGGLVLTPLRSFSEARSLHHFPSFQHLLE